MLAGLLPQTGIRCNARPNAFPHDEFFASMLAPPAVSHGAVARTPLLPEQSSQLNPKPSPHPR